MSYSYSPNQSAEAYRPSRRDNSTEASGVHKGVGEMLPQWATQRVRGIELPRSQNDLKALLWRTAKSAFTIANGLIVLWFFTLLWGERTVFEQSMEECAWGAWEKWPQDAKPHHVAFVADPQLVDPHTYPGRPWPLSTLTVKFTDQYLRRSFSSIQSHLDPDSVLFLGDLFDGGREWGTAQSTSPEEQYRKYKDSFWKQEFHRFVKIFLDPWSSQESHSTNPRGRVMISSLPGNHDLGFGSGVQLPVRDRFQNFFGKGNRVDIIGNHTFVSVDTVSLSAMDQPDPKTGSSGAGNGDGERPNQSIWEEPEDFLNKMSVHRGRAEMDELRFLGKSIDGRLFEHEVVDILDPSIAQDPQPEIIGFPTILLTHVPLYRKPATPCGPLREHYPPSREGELEEDELNALSISAGYQYQNVLTKTISNDLVSKVGPNLIHVYSGDDHDYCEVTHREFSGSPKEITVKSLSWAMGVRKPGFVLTSLWNPIDPATGKSIEQTTLGASLQNHLCLLPDQLSIFIHYGLVLGFTLVVLFLRAVIVALRPSPSTSPGPILPLSEHHDYPLQNLSTSSTSSSMSSSSLMKPGGLASRSANNPRTTPTYPYNDAYPSPDHAEDVDHSKWKSGGVEYRRRRGADTFAARIRHELFGSVRYVAQIVLPWYFLLIWRW